MIWFALHLQTTENDFHKNDLLELSFQSPLIYFLSSLSVYGLYYKKYNSMKHA